MTTVAEFKDAYIAMQWAEELKLAISWNDKHIFVVKDGRVISDCFSSAEELSGWIRCYKDISQGNIKV